MITEQELNDLRNIIVDAITPLDILNKAKNTLLQLGLYKMDRYVIDIFVENQDRHLTEEDKGFFLKYLTFTHDQSDESVERFFDYIRSENFRSTIDYFEDSDQRND